MPAVRVVSARNGKGRHRARTLLSSSKRSRTRALTLASLLGSSYHAAWCIYSGVITLLAVTKSHPLSNSCLPSPMKRCLYICYFGVREPLVQRQVLPYLAELKKDLASVSLVTFEPVPPERWDPGQLAGLRDSLGRKGIDWSHLQYHKRPTLPATALDIFLGAVCISRLARRQRIDILHCRGHVPMAMGVLAKRLAEIQLVFDIRGFMPEEYVDAGIGRRAGTFTA